MIASAAIGEMNTETNWIMHFNSSKGALHDIQEDMHQQMFLSVNKGILFETVMSMQSAR